MKRITLLFLILWGFTTSFAQSIDVKISPLALFYKKLEISGEYPISEKNGLELGFEKNFKKTLDLDQITIASNDSINGSGIFTTKKTSFYLHNKFYTKPKSPLNGFNLGVYGRFKHLVSTFNGVLDNKTYDTRFNWNKFVVGGTLGYKHVGESGLIFGFTMGLGYAIYSHINTDIAAINTTLKSLTILRLDYFGQLSVGYRINTP